MDILTIAFLVVLVIAAALAALQVRRSNYPHELILDIAGWMGGVLAVESFFLLPWVTMPPGALQKNTAWLISAPNAVIEQLQNIPALASLATDTITPADIINALDAPDRHTFTQAMQNGQPINGWLLMQLAFRVQPLLTLALALGGILAVVHAALCMQRMMSGRYTALPALQVITVLTVVCVLVLLENLTALDTLGETANFNLRLLAALAEAQVAGGVWGMLTGLSLCCISALWDVLPILAPVSNSEMVE